MACSKYTLTNTGSTIVNFNYRRCDDSMWEYQVELQQNQTKNIWLIDGTYSIAQLFESSVVLVDNGVYPTILPTHTPTATPTPTPTNTTTPTNTPTNTTTPTNTPTNTTTPTNTPTPTNTTTPTNTASVTPTNTASVTPTNTPTPTNTGTPATTSTPTPTVTNTPTHSRISFSITSGATSNVACDSGTAGTIYGDYSTFDFNTQFYNSLTGPVTINMTGYYSNSGLVVELTSGGTETGGYTLCSGLPTLTPTPTLTSTPTNTPTVTQTPTNTGTLTPTPTPTFGYYTYSLGTGVTANDACIDFSGAPNTIYGTVAGGVGPNTGEFLYVNTALTTPVANGYYSNGTAVYTVTGGAGLISNTDPNGC